MAQLVGINMTNFFRRPLSIYALGDIRFKKPISLRWMIYLMAGLLIWTLPIFTFVGLHMNPWYFMIILAPPILFAKYATKPVFGGKNLLDFTKTMIIYSKEPRGWTDLKNNNQVGKRTTYFIESEIWISRRRELQLLKELKARRKAEKRNRRKVKA